MESFPKRISLFGNIKKYSTFLLTSNGIAEYDCRISMHAPGCLDEGKKSEQICISGGEKNEWGKFIRSVKRLVDRRAD